MNKEKTENTDHVDKDELLKHYNQGLSDKELSDLFDITKRAVARLRYNLSLEPNKRLIKDDPDVKKIRSYVRKGYRDRLIGEKLDLSRDAIMSKRQRYNIPPGSEFHNQALVYHSLRGKKAEKIADIFGNISAKKIKQRRRKRGLPNSDALLKKNMDKVREMYENGKQPEDISDELDMDMLDVMKIIHAHNKLKEYQF